MKKAIVTVVIGNRYIHEWGRFFRPSWEQYARKHGYDIVALSECVDRTPRGSERTINWQKLLVLEHPRLAGYDHVVWLDSDILINVHKAPCIVSHHDSDQVGMVSNKQWLYGNRERVDNILRRQEELTGAPATPHAHYLSAGFPDDVDDYSNTGVIVMRPHHREVMRHVYDVYVENANSAKEETPLSYHLYKHDLVKPLDMRFNRTWVSVVLENFPWLLQHNVRNHALLSPLLTLSVTGALANNWFLHFTGDTINYQTGETMSLRGDVAYAAPCENIMAFGFT